MCVYVWGVCVRIRMCVHCIRVFVCFLVDREEEQGFRCRYRTRPLRLLGVLGRRRDDTRLTGAVQEDDSQHPGPTARVLTRTGVRRSRRPTSHRLTLLSSSPLRHLSESGPGLLGLLFPVGRTGVDTGELFSKGGHVR